jgi:hypothetical protein
VTPGGVVFCGVPEAQEPVSIDPSLLAALGPELRSECQLTREADRCSQTPTGRVLLQTESSTVSFCSLQ